jgi:hypothetical protein
MVKRVLAVAVSAAALLAASGCAGGSARDYDISPIFPLSSGKCAKYDGVQQGSGFTATCMVTKAECERAAADWRAAMTAGYVDDAIEFSCD